MASEPRRRTVVVPLQFQSRVAWRAGAAAGFVAAGVMALTIGLGNLALLRDAIAGLYLLDGSLVAGVLIHLVHGTLFGVVFAMILSDPGLYGLSQWRWKTTLAGIVYGLVLAVAGAGIIMPIWLDVVGAGVSRPIPNVTVSLLTWHVVYGTILGVVFSQLDHEPAERTTFV